jgi:hypothetical protein
MFYFLFILFLFVFQINMQISSMKQVTHYPYFLLLQICLNIFFCVFLFSIVSPFQ